MGSKKRADYLLKLTFDQLPSSLNRKLRSNRWKLSNENKSWDLMVLCQCQDFKPPKPLLSAEITLVRHAHRFLDFDGVVGSMKPVIDALVSAGIIADDNWNVTGPWIIDQRFRPKNNGPLLEVIIRETHKP